jgi:hypothetical protein
MFAITSCRWFVVAALFLVLVPACSGELEQDWPNSLRQASVYVNPSSNTGAAPFEALVSVNVHGHAGDTGTAKYGENVEIDYGDGSGWADVTTEVLAILFARDNGTAIPVSERFSHTYTDPGDYILRVRVTWQDNDVTYSPATSVPMITVTAPE